MQHLWRPIIIRDALFYVILLLGTVQWDWIGVGMRAEWKKRLVAKESWMNEWYGVKRRGHKRELGKRS